MSLYIGIDHHKKYSQVCVMDSAGTIVSEGPLPNTPDAFAALRQRWSDQELVCTLEAGRNWGILFDLLEDLGFKPVLANPYKVRMIADSYIKTDKIDARALATLLRIGMIPSVCVPPREIRHQKNLLRQRQWLVQEQTRLKNRIHNILDRNHINPPPLTDLFVGRGWTWMKELALPHPDDLLLQSSLQFLEEIRARIKEADRWIAQDLAAHPALPVLESLPGFGKILSSLAALEIFDIGRFANQERFVSYAGLAISTYSSGGKTYHGHLIPRSNRHLRYCFVEAAWSAVRHSPYFASYFQRLKKRLGSPKAIIPVARKLCGLAYICLKEQRPYEERPYHYRPVAVT
jgi:transposase